jgi:hypothetical protein
MCQTGHGLTPVPATGNGRAVRSPLPGGVPGGVPGGRKGPSITILHGSLREAVATARAAANGKDVVVVGANIAQQCLAEGLADEILLHLVPVVLGDTGPGRWGRGRTPPVPAVGGAGKQR